MLPEWIAWTVLEGVLLFGGLTLIAAVDSLRQRRLRARLARECTEIQEQVEAATAALDAILSPPDGNDHILAMLRNRIDEIDADKDPERATENAIRRAALSDEVALIKGFAPELLAEALGNLSVADDGGGSPSAAEMQDLKDMLKQVTRDSRNMLECIRDLETENEKLRNQLGLKPGARLGSTDAAGQTDPGGAEPPAAESVATGDGGGEREAPAENPAADGDSQPATAPEPA